MRPAHAVDRDLREVVERLDAVGAGVVLRGAVADLDQQPAGILGEQRKRVVRGDQVRVDPRAAASAARCRGRGPRRACPTRTAARRPRCR